MASFHVHVHYTSIQRNLPPTKDYVGCILNLLTKKGFSIGGEPTMLGVEQSNTWGGEFGFSSVRSFSVIVPVKSLKRKHAKKDLDYELLIALREFFTSHEKVPDEIHYSWAIID